jgi:two-component system chemotaxis response regulator CheB
MSGHDIIVVGTSAGGVETLSKLVAQFPEDLPATVFVVQHVIATAAGHLASILTRAGPLPAMLAEDGTGFKQSHIYVAPPDHHLLVKQGYVCVTRGLRENRVRPAIDPLFRSAAVAYGARVVGVVLTGLQSDGTAGLLAVKRCGGIAMVQEPEDALYPEMPQSALKYVEVDYCLPVSRMGAVLYRLTQEAPKETLPTPPDIVLEASLAEHPTDSTNQNEALGALAPLSCPDCGGPLWEFDQDQLRRYRCRIGHTFTAESLLAGQSEEIEKALWTAIRTMEERGRVLTSMAHIRRERGHTRLSTLWETQATELKTHAQQLRKLLLEQL